MRHQLLRTALRVVLTAAVAVCLFLFIRANWHRLTAHEISFEALPLLFAAALLVAFYLLYLGNWRWLIGRLDATAGLAAVALDRIFFLSMIVRYLPAGKAFNVGTRIELYRRASGRRAPAAASLYFEQIYFVGGAVLLMLVSTAAQPGATLLPDTPVIRAALGFAAVVLAGFLLAAPSGLLAMVGRVFRAKSLADSSLVLSPGDRARAFFRFLLVNAAQGAAAWFALRALYPPLEDRPDLLLPVLAAYPFSRFLGQLATVMPGGLGIREGAFSFLLAGDLPVQVTLAAAAVLRLLAVLLELVALLVVTLRSRGPRDRLRPVGIGAMRVP